MRPHDQAGQDDCTVMNGIPSLKGTYCLILYLTHKQRLIVGQLGEVELRPGYYIYVGSAFGPGGLRTRLTHHLRRTSNMRWHIDYLREYADIMAIWYSIEQVKRESDWVFVVSQLEAGTSPVAGFGASDSAHASHLFYIPNQPSSEKFRMALRCNGEYSSQVLTWQNPGCNTA